MNLEDQQASSLQNLWIARTGFTPRYSMLLNFLQEHDYDTVRGALAAMLKRNDQSEMQPGQQESYFSAALRSMAPPRARPEPAPLPAVELPARPRSFSTMQQILGMYSGKDYVPPASPRALTPEEQQAADLLYAEFHMENLARTIESEEDS